MVLPLLASVLLLAPTGCLAGGGPENLALVVNADSPDSLAVASEYISLRQVPPSNVIRLSSLPSAPKIKLAEFKGRILEPVLKTLEERGLTEQIDYLVYSAGFPFAVDVREEMAGKQFPRFITQPASLTGVTYFRDLVQAGKSDYLAIDANWYARRLKNEKQEAPWAESDQALVANHPADPDLASLRERDDLRALVAKMRQVIVETQPAQAFHSTIRWDRDGQPTTSDEGRRYVLSAMLAYTGGPANTLDEALASLRRSCAADGTCPPGTIYCMVSTDRSRTGPRQAIFRSAVEALGRLGVQGEVLDGVLPKDRTDVAGAMVGVAGFTWKDCGSTILPGAFCDHLTSFGGVMTGTGQTLLSEFLRCGAAGACGTVAEPYAIPGKFPSPFLHVYYASGCSLAEAFYQSVRGPYQQLLVGDPLCRPWARIPEVRVKGLAPDETIKRPRRLRPMATSADPVARFELFVDGRRVQTCEPGKALLLDPAGLADGTHEARVVAIAGPLETQGRTILPFRVRRRGGKGH